MYDDDFAYQNAWNNHAADYNAQVLRDRYAEPQADPRALAAQSLVQRYQPKAPSYANINGNYFVNGEPFHAPDGFAGADAEAAAQHQYAQSKQRAAQDMLARRSGDYAAGTSGRTLLTDPQFMRMQQPDQDAIYQQVYGNSLAEDMQADRWGGQATIHDVRNLNTLPQRQKSIGEEFKIMEQALGANPMQLVGDLTRDDKGAPLSGYDPAKQVSWIPGREVSDGMGGFVHQPAHSVPFPQFQYNRVRDLSAQLSGLDHFPQPVNPTAAFQNSPMGNYNPARGNVSVGILTPDPTRDTKLKQMDELLKLQGINLHPDQLHEVIRRSINTGMGGAVDEHHVIAVARAMQDDERMRQQQIDQARNAYNSRQFTPTSSYMTPPGY